MSQDPLTLYPRPPFASPSQGFPGRTGDMKPKPDHGEESYKGSGRLVGKVALITGGDSGIGRAVAIAYAREGADVAISYLDEEKDAQDTAEWVEKAGRKALLLPGDIAQASLCRELVAKTVDRFGKLDVLVNNGAYQHPFDSLEACSDEEWEKHFSVNVHAQFYLTKAAVGVMKPGASVIATASVNTKHPLPKLFAYSATKGAIGNMVMSWAQLLAEKGIRVNGVMPGPIWTPFIPAGMSKSDIESFGSQVPYGRPGQPVEVAPPYVMLASDESSYISGALITVAGGMPIF